MRCRLQRAVRQAVRPSSTATPMVTPMITRRAAHPGLTKPGAGCAETPTAPPPVPHAPIRAVLTPTAPPVRAPMFRRSDGRCCTIADEAARQPKEMNRLSALPRQYGCLSKRPASRCYRGLLEPARHRAEPHTNGGRSWRNVTCSWGWMSTKNRSTFRSPRTGEMARCVTTA